MVERDTVKRSLWRPTRGTEKQDCLITICLKQKSINHKTKVKHGAVLARLLCRDAIGAVRKGTCVYVCVWRVRALVCIGWRGKGRVCYKGSRVVCLKVPKGAWISSCPFITFLKGLYSFYLRKRDQPMGKWGQRWEHL